MSLGINVTIPEGIVLAADSRQTYRNQKGMARVGSDSASKVFRIGSRMGLVIAGLAFMPQLGVMKNVSGFIDDFRQTIPVDKLSVGEVAKELAQYFDARVPYRDSSRACPPASRQTWPARAWSCWTSRKNRPASCSTSRTSRVRSRKRLPLPTDCSSFWPGTTRIGCLL